MIQLEEISAPIIPLEPKTKEELLDILNRYKIPVEQWRKGEAKTSDDLFTEIQDGETKLFEKDRKLIIRNTNG